MKQNILNRKRERRKTAKEEVRMRHKVAVILGMLIFLGFAMLTANNVAIAVDANDVCDQHRAIGICCRMHYVGVQCQDIAWCRTHDRPDGCKNPDGTIRECGRCRGTGVGGDIAPIDKPVFLSSSTIELTPYIALASTILVATAAITIYVKRRKKKQ